MTVAVGTKAPTFSLPSSEAAPRSLTDLIAGGPVLLVFFKTSCPTCVLAFPVYGELERRYGDVVPVVAVSQDPLLATVPWLRSHGFGGIALDDSSGGYAASAAYGVQVVPTLVLVDAEGRVAAVNEAWDRDGVNELAARLDQHTGRLMGPVSTPEDGRPPFKPG
jgi:peroxiredoxin